MKRMVILTVLIAVLPASARLIQMDIKKDVSQIDAKYVREKLNIVGYLALHGNAACQYTSSDGNDEFLILTIDPVRATISTGVGKMEGESRVPKRQWSGCWSGVGCGGSNFDFPRGVCIKPAASTDRYLYIFVADEGNDRVVELKYDKQTRNLHWVRAITTGLDEPTDVDCIWLDEANNKATLAIASSWNNKILFYQVNSDGSVSYLTSYSGQLSLPSSVALDGSGEEFFAYVADRANQQLVCLRGIDFLSTPTIQHVESISMPDPTFSVSVANLTPEGFPEHVVFVHQPNRRKIVAYGRYLGEKLYETDVSRSIDLSVMDGECLLTEHWSYSSGIKYFWLDSEFENAGAIPNCFTIGDDDVVIPYVLTGGGLVNIRVKDYQNNVVKVIEDDEPASAGRHWAIWDGKNTSGQYVSEGTYYIHLEVDDYYDGDESDFEEPLNDYVIVSVMASNDSTVFHTSFEESDSPDPSENYLWMNGCADYIAAEIVEPLAGSSPYPIHGTRMYKFTGRDTSSDATAGRLAFHLFPQLVNVKITNPMYLSYWVYADELPENKSTGRAILTGHFKNHPGATWFENWENYGRILDTRSNPIDPTKCTPILRDGKWHQYVYTMTPSAGDSVLFFFLMYEEEPPEDTGRFTFYFDDFQLTPNYPGKPLEWYAENFATGDDNGDHRDCNFDMTFYARDLDQRPDHAYMTMIFLNVDGNGDFQNLDSNCCECLDDDNVWIHPNPGPGIRLEIPTQVRSIDNSTNISWWQFDRAHSLVLGALIEDNQGDTNWLYWAWNAPSKWNHAWLPGYVDMNGNLPDEHDDHYNEWEGCFERNIRTDYYNEFGATANYIRSLRVAHYCRSDWEGNHGGIIKDLYLGSEDGPVIDTVPPDSFPDPPRFAPIARTGGGSLLAMGPASTRNNEKMAALGWNLGEAMAPEECALYLSRDGGETFEYQITDTVSPGTKQPLDTIIIDDTLETVRYVLKGSYDWDIGAPPTSEAQIKLVVTDSNSGTYEYLSNLFQVHIPSALYWPLEGNADLVAVNPVNGKLHLAWTTWGATDSTARYVFYTSSTDGIKWDTLECPTPYGGRRPSIYLNSQGNTACIHNDANGSLYLSHYYGDEWTSENISPSNPPNADFTANCIMAPYDTMHFGLFARTTTGTAVIYAKEKYPITQSLSVGYTLGTYTEEPDVEYAPAIALDMNGLPHITYRIAGNVYYAHFTGTSWVSDSFASDTTCHPSISCVEGNVYILYRNPDKKLARKLGYIDGTLTSEQIISATTGDILDPRLVGSGIVVFTDNSDSTSREVRFSQFDSETNSFSYPFLISDVERNAYSPQGAVLPNSNLWLLWTEDRGAHNKIAYLELDPLYEVPCCELDAGWNATPYTTYRDTVASYVAVTVDVGTDSLRYDFSGMNNSEQHSVLLEFFFEHEAVESTNYIVVCGSEIDTLEIEEGYVNQFYYGLSSGYSTIPVTVYATDTIQAQMARAVIYETRSAGLMGLAGARGKVTPLPQRFALYQNAPNPFVSTTTIRYALPYAAHVNLSVYDVSGRRVSVLHKGEQKAGVHTLQWNGKDDSNVPLAAGIYFMRFEADDYVESRKAVLLH